MVHWRRKCDKCFGMIEENSVKNILDRVIFARLEWRIICAEVYIC